MFEQTFKDPNAYACWAKSYDQDLEKLNFKAPEILGGLVCQLCPTGTALDIGCGTGLLVAAIRARGNLTLVFDGCDRSVEMLKVARGKQLYRKLFADDFSTVADKVGVYSLVTACGVFAGESDQKRTGDPDAKSVDAVLKLLDSGGIFMFSVSERTWATDASAYQIAFSNPRWKLLHHSISGYHDRIPNAHYFVLQASTINHDDSQKF